MADEHTLDPERWAGAAHAAALFAVDPVGTGGIRLRARAGPVRDAWCAFLDASLPSDMPRVRVPAGVDDGRLLGGLDLAATLQAGRRIVESGLLVAADGGLLTVAMAERLDGATAARIVESLDRGSVALEREGVSRKTATRFGLCLLDEGAEPDEAPPASLLDRTAFHLDLSALSLREVGEAVVSAPEIMAARGRLGGIGTDQRALEAVCEAAAGLGIASLRAPLLALAAARANAALRNAAAIEEPDLLAALRLVLLPRATRLPAEESAEDSDEPPPAPPEDEDLEEGSDPIPSEPHEARDSDEPGPDPGEVESGGERLLEAATATLPAGLLERLRSGQSVRSQTQRAGRAGAQSSQPRRGRPIGVRAGRPGSGGRLNIAATLRAAIPWQSLRTPPPGGRVAVRGEDFRLTRLKARTETVTIFAVDASGSTALARLAEAKGAVELLLADCYVRRDEVALIAFRGTEAEVLLPPTRSLLRAKRSLAGLPGGGGTPLGRGIAAAESMAEGERRKGRTPLVVVMTDGKANIGDDGQPGRARAQADATAAARRLRATGVDAILIDTSQRPQARASELAAEMGARYLALPRADAAALSQAVRGSQAASAGSS